MEAKDTKETQDTRRQIRYGEKVANESIEAKEVKRGKSHRRQR